MSNNRCRITIIALALTLLAPASLLAKQRATAAEAQDFVARAIALYDKAGKDAAFAAIEDPKGKFVDHDLYVFVFGPDRTIVAHGHDKSLVGTAAHTLIDADGVHFGDKFMDEATAEGHWVDYKWRDPVTRKVLPKSSWVVLHDGFVFGAGIYKPSQ